METGNKISELQLDSAPIRISRYAQGCREGLYVIDALAGVLSSIIVGFDVNQFKKTPKDCDIFKFSVTEKPKVTVAIWGYLNKTIITGHEKGYICVWDTKTNEPLLEKKIFDKNVTDIQMDTTYAFFVASSKDHSAKIIDANTLEVMKVFKADRPLNSVSLSPIRPHVIVGGGQEAADVTTTHHEGKFRVRFFHVAYGEEIGSVEGHFGPVNTLEFSPDGRSFTSGGEDGYIRINHLDDDYFEFKYAGSY